VRIGPRDREEIVVRDPFSLWVISGPLPAWFFGLAAIVALGILGAVKKKLLPGASKASDGSRHDATRAPESRAPSI
jgi:hypothetical protein